jgi:hypothetical protein
MTGLDRLTCPSCETDNTWRFIGRAPPMAQAESGRPIWGCRECDAQGWGPEPRGVHEVRDDRTAVMLPHPESKGWHYHRPGSAGGHRVRLGTLSDAKARGLDACGTCEPPEVGE